MTLRAAPNTSEGAGAPRRRGRIGLAVIGLVAAVAAGGWAYIMANVGQRPGISQETISFKVVDDSTVRLTFSVAKPRDREVRCTIDAVDTDFAPVAGREIIVPRGTQRVERAEVLRTTRRATAARVKDCHAV